MTSEMCGAVPWLRRFVVGFSPRKPRFDPRPVHIGFVVGKVALGQFIYLFSLKYCGVPLLVSFHQCYILFHMSATL